eukprot:151325-Chlamydomonas_euryale.AAC.27
MPVRRAAAAQRRRPCPSSAAVFQSAQRTPRSAHARRSHRWPGGLAGTQQARCCRRTRRSSRQHASRPEEWPGQGR